MENQTMAKKPEVKVNISEVLMFLSNWRPWEDRCGYSSHHIFSELIKAYSAEPDFKNSLDFVINRCERAINR